ncbi:MAG TPA: S8 family serine peptidase, partial [Terriglobales bacterium]|nr:S8 family serine peptidase [Terriglobales bacterium]
MKPSFLSLAAFILVFSFLCSSFASAQDEQPGQLPQAATFLPTHGVQYAPDHVLVRFRPGTAKQVAESAHMTVGAQVLRIYSVVEGLELVRLAPGVPVDEGVRLYRQFPDVLYAEPDYLRSATLTPNDPQYSSLWGMSNIRAPQAWDLSTGSNSVVVGDIDTGTDYNHPDLAANIYSNTTECNGAPNTDNDGNGYKNDCHGINAITGSGDPMDDNGHGTHTAGSVGAVGNNNVGVVGVNWNVKILPCKFLAANGSGYDSDAIECLQYYGWMHDHGVNLVAINASWGGAGYNQALSDAIYSQMVRGILFFAAAGNAGSNNDLLTFYPASYYLPNLVSVAAIDSGNNLAGFSDYGQTSVHLGAPGVGIRSTTPSNNYATWDGTSMATPYVTGVAALLMAQNSQRDWKAVRNLILAGGTATSSLTSKTITGKRLDAYGAMTCSNQALTARVQPRTNPATSVVTVVMGRPVLLAALHINCAAPSGNVTVTVNPGGNLVYLHDDGTDGDLASGDGIYTAQWTPDSLGTYTLAFPGGDNVTLQVLTTYQVGPTSYSWTEIAGSNPIPLDGEDVTTVCPSFFVKFGEGSFNCFRVSSVGGITFDDSLLAYPAPLPTTLTHSLVAPFWDFLEPTKTDASRMLFWQTSGVAPHRKAIIEWYQVPHSNYPAVVPSENITFEVVLFEDKSDVLIEYKDVIFGGSTAAYDSGRWASTGVQTGVSDAEQWGYQTTNLSNNFALGFVRNAPSPSATSLSPSTLPQGSSAFQLTVTGRNFVTNSVVRWNGNNRTTYYDNPRQLRADISAADVASFGTANVTVYTPILGGGTSGVLTFTISPFSNPVPVITSIDPQSVPGNTAPLTVTVHGSNFVPGSVVWNTNGSPQTTHYVNSTTLTVDVETQFHVLASSWLMQVVNPAPGGGNSNAVEFDVTSNVVPTNLSLTPQVVRAGGSGFTLNIYGEYFAAGAVVLWNGVPHAYNMVNIVSLNVPVSAAEIASGGNVAVTVTNPPPTGGTSAATFLPVWDFSIVAPKGFFVVPGATTDIGFKLHPVAGQ